MTKGQGRFLKIKCHDCPNEQIVFERAATIVTCQVCGAVVCEPTGGIAIIKGEIVGVVE